MTAVFTTISGALRRGLPVEVCPLRRAAGQAAVVGAVLLALSGCCEMTGGDDLEGTPGGGAGGGDAAGELVPGQDASSQDASSQDASSQDASSQDASSQDASSQDASSQDASSQDASSLDGTMPDASSDGGLRCAEGYVCFADPESDVLWVMKEDGNVNGPTCQRVCERALSQNRTYYACDHGRPVAHTDLESFGPVAEGLGFECREGGCWWPNAPGEGMILVSRNTADDGSKTCFFPTGTEHSCTTHPGNANCFGERYATVCPCVPKALDEACEWDCPPHHTTRAFWDTDGTSCVERINYWRRRACEEGWVECPPAGLPPMVECTACHECANSEADTDADEGSHSSFGRCGEHVQGQGGGATCGDVIDSFIAERVPDEHGVMRCQGHCGPIVAHGCQTFHWGRDRDSGFHTLNWRSCNVETCDAYCQDNPGACFSLATSPSMTCQDPDSEE